MPRKCGYGDAAGDGGCVHEAESQCNGAGGGGCHYRKRMTNDQAPMTILDWLVIEIWTSVISFASPGPFRVCCRVASSPGVCRAAACRGRRPEAPLRGLP